MKGLVNKIKNPKVAIFTTLLILLAIFSPISPGGSFLISKNSSNAATESVTAILNSHTSNVIWVTQSKLTELLQTGEWQTAGSPNQVVDASNIINGIVKDGVISYSGGASGGWIASLAKAVAGYIINSILAVIYLVLWVVYSIFYGLTLLSEKILEIILDPLFVSKDGYLGGFTTKEFVRNAAQLLANLCNMLYLFVLMYIAIKTMLGDSNTRGLLTKLVIAALLTNFGLVLAGVLIDFSQVIMYTIWDGIKGSSGSFAPGTKILDKLQSSLGAGRSVAQINSLFDEATKFLTMSVGEAVTEITKIASLIVMSLALTITLFSIAVVLMVRIVGLWVLLILTPVAFLFSVLPQTEKHWNSWLETLTKYAFTGPILIFFLWLGLKLSSTVTNATKLNEIGNNIPNNGDIKYLFFSFIAKNMNIVFEMGTIVITLWAGIIIANRFGIKGAKSLDGLINSTTRLPGKLSRGFGHTVSIFGRLNQFTMQALQGRRKRKIENLTKQMVLAEENKDPVLAKERKSQIDNLNKKVESKDKWIMRWRKGLALMTPQTMKKELASYLKNKNAEYFEGTESSLRELGKDSVHYLTRRRRRDAKQLAADNAEISLRDGNRELQKLLKKYKEYEAARDLKGMDETKQKINSTSTILAGQISENKKDKKKIAEEIYDEVIKGRPDGNFISQKYIDEGRILAEKKKYEDFWQSFTLKLEKEKEVKNRNEYLDKLKLTPEQMVAMFRRGDGDRSMQIALLRKIAASGGKIFGDLMQKMANSHDLERVALEISRRDRIPIEEGRKKAPEEIRQQVVEKMKERTSEGEVISGMRAADGDARKSHNLSQVGLVAFDQISGKWRISNEEEKKGLLGKYIKDMRPIEINQLHMQTFEDDGAIDSFAKNINWANLLGDERFVRGLKESIVENLVKNKEKILSDIEKPEQKTAFEKLLVEKERQSHTQ